jgi:hypothetical protein
MPVANACATQEAFLSAAAAGPDQAGTDPDNIGSACIPIDINIQVDSLEQRVRNLEAQHVWLRVELLETEIARLKKLLEIRE